MHRYTSPARGLPLRSVRVAVTHAISAGASRRPPRKLGADPEDTVLDLIRRLPRAYVVRGREKRLMMLLGAWNKPGPELE